MAAALEELTELVTPIHGLSPVGAAAILAEAGDPTRFATARALVKHAGLAPSSVNTMGGPGQSGCAANSATTCVREVNPSLVSMCWGEIERYGAGTKVADSLGFTRRDPAGHHGV
jgi:transposase